MDYLKEDDDYIQLVANDYAGSGSITQTEENAFNIIAVCECFREKALTPRPMIFNICFKYLEDIAYNRVVMEYITEFFHRLKDSSITADSISRIWIAYFNDGRYGHASARQICERFDITPAIAEKIVEIMRYSTDDNSTWIRYLLKCGQKRLQGEQVKMLNAENKKYVDYDDVTTVDCIVERIIT